MGTGLTHAKRSLVEFKNAMLMGLYNAKLRKTCLLFRPKEIQHKNEIKDVLEHQLVNLRTYNTDPRATSHDMAGLRSNYEKNVDCRSEEMLKTGQVPLEVNAMPGLMMDESDAEGKDELDDKDVVGSVNAMQGSDACFFCKRKGHLKKDCRKYKEWKKKNSIQKSGNSTR